MNAQSTYLPRAAHALAVALAIALLPAEAWASAEGAHAAFAAIDTIQEWVTGIAKPAFVISIAIAGYTWGLSRSDIGMRRAFNAAIGCGLASGATMLADTLNFTGAIF